MSKKIKLTKIVLETQDGKHVELSMDEAKELHDQLHELFGAKITYVPSQPVIIERHRWPHDPWGPLRPTWCDNTRTGNGLPENGGLDLLCQVTGKSGLSVGYCGSETD